MIRYLPLGDSYTIGEGVIQKDSFPFLLANELQKRKIIIDILANPAVTGYTTQNLIEQELPLLQKLKPNFITLLIGVNDWVQGISEVQYKHVSIIN